MDTQAAVKTLLANNGMDPDMVDFSTMMSLFAGQMRIGLYGGHATVPMLPTGLPALGTPPAGEPVAVAQLREGEVRTALVTLGERGEEGRVEELTAFPAPGLDYPAPWEDLIYALAELLEPLLDRTRRIALCLPFPLDWGEEDATILALPGHLRLTGWQGQKIIHSLTRELASRHITGKTITLLPLAAAAQLGGNWCAARGDRVLGLAWGDQVDVALAAPWSVVLKRPGRGDALTLLDTAVGQCTGVPIGTVELTMDRDAPAPGHALLDKMVSSRTLGEIYRFTMIKAVEEGLLTFGCGRDFLSLRSLTLAEVADFLRHPQGESRPAAFCQEEGDRAVALLVGEKLLDRAAKLLCAHLAACLNLVGGGRDPHKPAVIAAEGVLLDIPSLRARLEAHLAEFVTGKLGRHCLLHTGEELTLTGAGVAALLAP